MARDFWNYGTMPLVTSWISQSPPFLQNRNPILAHFFGEFCPLRIDLPIVTNDHDWLVENWNARPQEVFR